MRGTFCSECPVCPLYLVYRTNRDSVMEDVLLTAFLKLIFWQHRSWGITEMYFLFFHTPAAGSYITLWFPHQTLQNIWVQQLVFKADLRAQMILPLAWGICKSLKVLLFTLFQGDFTMSNIGSEIFHYCSHFDLESLQPGEHPLICVPSTPFLSYRSSLTWHLCALLSKPGLTENLKKKKKKHKSSLSSLTLQFRLSLEEDLFSSRFSSQYKSLWLDPIKQSHKLPKNLSGCQVWRA